MGKRERERIERIRSWVEAPISPVQRSAMGWEMEDDWGKWEKIADLDERAPIWYMKQFLDEGGIPYQVSDESCPVLPDQYGEAIVFNCGSSDETAELCRRITLKWIAEGRPDETGLPGRELNYSKGADYE